jgi:hypothetical protein
MKTVNSTDPQITNKKMNDLDGYPQLIEMELRNAGQKPGEGLKVGVRWLEVFWDDMRAHSHIQVVTGYDDYGDSIYEIVTRCCKHGSRPAAYDCFKFRGEDYDFCAFRSDDGAKNKRLPRKKSEYDKSR